VTGGEFNRLNSSGLPAKVSPFQLDRFEVTVARFRTFVQSGAGTQSTQPPPGAGAHPGANMPYSGWQSSWDHLLPQSSDALKNLISGGTWTSEPGDSENRPITNVPWLVAFAFCAWDGGRLPTLAEWSFAASNGSEQRLYPWSSPPANDKIDATFAAYNCAVTDPPYSCPLVCSAGAYSCANSDCTNALGTCSPGPCIGCDTPADIAKVGTRTAGKGNFGQFDLAGNVAEYVLDATAPGGSLPGTCNDCALLMGPNPEGPLTNPSDDWEVFVVNGSWSGAAADVQNSVSNKRRFNKTDNTIGFRCARD
jgi:formylglycine-generating enzyme required for sulfatase activity